MTTGGLFALFLFLHVLGAIVAFGPSLSFALIGPFASREPQHANFAVRLQEMLSKRLVVPVGLTMPVTGAALILIAGIDLASRRYWWLGLAILLYAIAIGYAIFVQLPTVARLVALTSGGPPAGASGGPPPAGPMAASQGVPGAAPGPPGPPPHIAAVINKAKRGGMLLSALIVVIVLLMVVKPQF